MSGMTDAGLLLILDAVRKALAEDDDLPEGQKKYEVREQGDWKKWSDQIEAALSERGTAFETISW